jgi:uncharacterized repeat protein (TIGR01451 family)
LLLTADLSISNSQIAPLSLGLPAGVSQGEMITYQIAVANNGATAADNVALNDNLPMGETLVSATTNSGVALSQNGSTVTGNLGTIDAGSSVTVTIDALVNDQVTGTLSNTASVSSPDENSGSPVVSAPVSTTIDALVSTAPSLAVTGTAANNNGAVSIGASETYTLTVTNDSANAAQNVTVSDALPVGATFQAGTVTGGTGQTTLSAPVNGLENIDLGTLAANASATITLTIAAPNQVGLMVNTATVADSAGNASVDNATASLATAVQGTTNPTTGSVDLSITKTVAVTGSVNASQTETITVTNQGTAAATGVVVSDLLPSDAQFISGSTSVNGVNVSATGGVATATLPLLAAGQSATITLTLTPTITGALTDTAYAESDQPDANQTNNVAAGTTLVTGLTAPAVDLSVTTTPSSVTGQVGSNETYTITVANNSANVATGVVVSDVLPASASFVSATDGNSNSLLPVGNLLTDRIGTLAANSSETLTITLGPTASGIITNTAYVSSDDVDTNLANNVATLSTPIQGTTTANVDLSITASAANNNANVTLGNNETYTLTVTNNGTSAATNVVVSDVLPTAATFVGGTTSVNGVGVANIDGAVTADLGPLNAGQTATVTITLTPTAVGALTDTASVESDDIDANQLNNLANVTTQIVSAATEANLSVATIAEPTATVGQDLVYSLVVTNTGAAAADNVSVSDTLPSGVTLVSDASSLSGAVLSNNNGTITANLGIVAAGAVDILTIIVTPSQAATLSNTAAVTTTSANASAQTSSTVQTTVNSSTNSEANLSITQTPLPGLAIVGQDLVYTVSVTNAAGAAAADNVVVTDTLPAGGIAFVSGGASVNGVTVADNNGTITADLGTVAAGATDTITFVVTPTVTGTIANTASVTTSAQNASSSTSTTVNTVIHTGGQSCYLNGQPGDNSDQTFLTNLYRELLNRNPDATGFQFWLNFLATNGGATASGQSNAVTRQFVIQAFLHSQEYELNFVDGVYEEFLGRQADGGGESYFVNQLSAGVSEEAVIVQILGSSEYFADSGSSNQTFVENLYLDLLGRPADPGSDTWINALNIGQTRTQVVQAILQSSEAAKDVLDAGATGGVPGTPATGSYPLAALTGGGWDNLYFQGRLSALDESAVDQFMSELEAGASWQAVQQQMLNLPQYYNVV